jgi:hypothetical protein
MPLVFEFSNFKASEYYAPLENLYRWYIVFEF